MALLLGIVGAIGMVVSLGRAGVDAQNNSNDLKKQIQSISDNNKLIEQNYKKLTDNIASEQAELAQGIIDANDRYILISSKLRASQDNFSASFKKVQLVGIIFIIIVFALLLLKQFGLLDVIMHYLDLPFIWLWHQIVGNKNSSSIKKAT